MFSLGHWNYNNQGRSESVAIQMIMNTHANLNIIGILSFFAML